MLWILPPPEQFYVKCNNFDVSFSTWKPSRIVPHPTILFIIPIIIPPANVIFNSTAGDNFLTKTIETLDIKQITTLNNTNSNNLISLIIHIWNFFYISPVTYMNKSYHSSFFQKYVLSFLITLFIIQ